MTEATENVPTSWAVVPLGQFVENEKGKKPIRQKDVPDEKYIYPYVDIEAFEEGNLKSWTDGEGCRLCSEDDFLMVWDGSRSGLVGKGMNGALGSTLVRINFPQIENNYAFYFLQSKYLEINTRAKGSGTPHVDPDLLWNYKFPIAPRNEQSRIVAKIEELFSELDKGIESLKAAQKQLKVYRQAVLKHAFEGKLTAQWREENKGKLETAEKLLARIQKEREDRYLQQLEDWEKDYKKWEVGGGKDGKKPSKPAKLKYYSDLSLEDKASLPKLPEYWVWAFLNNVVERIQIGPFGSLLHKEDYVRHQVPLVNPSHIKNMVIVPDLNLTVSKEKIKELKKYVMDTGDIVVGRRGEMGRCAVVSNNEKGWLCGTGSLFVRVLPSLNPAFFCYILGSRRVRDFLSDSSIGTTMQNLNQKILQIVPVPLCDPLEQIEVVNEITKQLSIIDVQEKDIEYNLGRTETLRQSILKKAFSGQLIEQDPNDEPASVLLERIKAEKAQQLSKKKTARKRKAVTA